MTIDLSRVPVPDAVDTLTAEQIISRIKADFAAEAPELAGALELESEPVTQLINLFAYRERLLREQMNETVRSMCLAHARGANLDALAANYNTTRLLIRAATDSTPAVYESDDALRYRCLLAFAAMSTAGSSRSYEYHALSAHADVKQVMPLRYVAGVIDVVILSHSADGVPSAEVLSAVEARLTHPAIKPLADLANNVKAVVLKNWQLNAQIEHDPSFDTSALQAAATQFVADAKKIGAPVRRSAIFGLLHAAGVRNVRLDEPTLDVEPTDYEAPHCAAVTLTFTEVAA